MKKIIGKGIQKFFRVAENLAPPLANYYAIKLFTKPLFPLRFTEKDKVVLSTAKKVILSRRPSPLYSYVWGDEKNPKVLLMHGWNGKSMQFRDYVQPLVEAGFCVVAIDAPGHGNSKAKRSHILAFTDSILKAQESFGDFEAVIAHSLGAVATMYAIKKGLRLNILVSMSALTIGEDIYTQFQKKLNISDNTVNYIKQNILDNYQLRVDDVVASSFNKEIEAKTKHILIVHDKKDREVRFEHAEVLVKLFDKKVDQYFTEGFGHARILKNPNVIRAVTNYVVKSYTN